MSAPKKEGNFLAEKDQRIAALEERLAAQEQALAALNASFGRLIKQLGCDPLPHSVKKGALLRVRGVTILDDDGNERGNLSCDDGQGGYLELTGDGGDVGAQIRVVEGAGQLELFGPDNFVCVEAGVKEGHGFMLALAPAGKPAAGFKSTEIGGVVTVTTDEGNPVGVLRADEDGGRIDLLRPDGKRCIELVAPCRRRVVGGNAGGALDLADDRMEDDTLQVAGAEPTPTIAMLARRGAQQLSDEAGLADPHLPDQHNGTAAPGICIPPQ